MMFPAAVPMGGRTKHEEPVSPRAVERDMAGGMDLGGGGRGRRPLDTTINLVPFIDLMAVTIVFLIMTAVWTQTGGLQALQQGGVEDSSTRECEEAVTLEFTATALRLHVGSSVFEPLPLVRDPQGRLELSHLAKKLAEVKRELPERNAITLRAEDTVRYEDLVRVIDLCVGEKFPAVTVSPSS
jgi:biopolymer transport protein ExbD